MDSIHVYFGDCGIPLPHNRGTMLGYRRRASGAIATVALASKRIRFTKLSNSLVCGVPKLGDVEVSYETRSNSYKLGNHLAGREI